MGLFKRNKKTSENSIKQTKKEYKNNADSVKIKKKTRIGFRRKNKESSQKEKTPQDKKEERKKVEIETIQIKDSLTPEKDIELEKEADAFLDEIQNEKELDIAEKDRGNEWSTTKKRKTFMQRDMKEKPVFLEDNGEKLGVVFDMIYDGEKKLIGYKVKDEKSDSVLSFPIDQFDETKDGLIFVQSWYINALKTLDRLEFKERVSPELTTLLSDDSITNEELYNIFVKHDDQMVNYIEDAVSLKELINQRLRALEKQRLTLKDSLMDLTEKRLIKDIDRREFSEDVAAHRRKVNVLDVNIKKCKDLLKRLDTTSFGKIGKNVLTHKIIEDKSPNARKSPNNTKVGNSFVFAEEIENPYKQKYNDMKERFDKLQEDYNELKSAVEKLITKGEL
jgi:hypothetical protein